MRWLVLLLLPATAAAQDRSAAHMEGCLVWNREGNVAVRNECSRPISLMFMDFDVQQPLSGELAPGASYTTPALWGRSGGFMFTACPSGLQPSVRFALENKETIGASLYNCVTNRPTS